MSEFLLEFNFWGDPRMSFLFSNELCTAGGKFLLGLEERVSFQLLFI
jgi:hypothetical protein